MTGMLASVTSISEAEIVLAAGADIVDIKNPHEGALGALDVNDVKSIVHAVNNTTPVSATIGDINPDDRNLFKYIKNMANTGVDYVKVGLFDLEVSNDFINVIKRATQDINLVIVLFAENYPGIETIEQLLETGIAGVMLDTKDKRTGNLCSILDETKLKEFVEAAKNYNLLTGLAGSLRYEDIQPLVELSPDYLGFRGALCSENDRVKVISKEQVKKIRSAIPISRFVNYDQQYRDKYMRC